jgi:hypothetical protein
LEVVGSAIASGRSARTQILNCMVGGIARFEDGLRRIGSG